MWVRRVWPARPNFENLLSDLAPMQSDMQRLLEALRGEGASDSWVFPPVNVTQDANNFYLRAEVPGMKAEDIAVTTVRNRVSISGKREIPKEHERASYHRRERADGSFNRTLTLPVEVDSARVDARYSDGILTLTLPKAEEAKARQIAVKS